MGFSFILSELYEFFVEEATTSILLLNAGNDSLGTRQETV